MLAGIWSWLGAKAAVGANDDSPAPGAKDAAPVGPAGTRFFEPLEPRLLLNADLPGLQPPLTCGVSLSGQAVCVDLNRQEGSIRIDVSPVLAMEVAPRALLNESASASMSSENAAVELR